MMIQNFLAYIILFQLLVLLVKINCYMIPFRPRKRYCHTATFVDNKLYILGGHSSNTGGDFFYLDTSYPFNTKELPWKDLSSINVVPPHFGAASVKGGVNNDTLILYGGISFNTTNNTMELIYTYDSQSNMWNSPKTVGNNNKKTHLTAIMDYNGKMHLWSGINVENFATDMLILDTINFNWMVGGYASGAPIPRINYGAVLLPDNNIIYIGGYNDIEFEFVLDQVYIYDTTNDSWSTRHTSGEVRHPSRDGFSVVLGLDGKRIIVFGGTIGSYNDLDPKDSLYVLNLTNFEWYIPKISGQIPSSRSYHKANVIGKYMVISFGRNREQSIGSDILLLDINDNDEYVWTDNFIPQTSFVPYVPPLYDKKLVVIGAIMGSLLCGSLLSFGGFFLYKWNKGKQTRKISNDHAIEYLYPQNLLPQGFAAVEQM